MHFEVVFSEEAELHLQELEEYLVARFYPLNAQQYIQRLIAACLRLGTAPYQGTKRDDLALGIRAIGFERRVAIYFKVVEERVLILGLFYGGRRFDLQL